MRALRIHCMLAAVTAAVCAAVAAGPAEADPSRAAAPDTSRIVSIGGDVTEIIYALGAGERIVAIDATSQFPPEALATKPSVGYMRALSSEGVLSMRPSLILANASAGPPEVIRALKSSSVPYVEVPDDDTPEGVRRRIRTVSEALGTQSAGDRLLAGFDANMQKLQETRRRVEAPKSVLFVLAAQGGRAIIGGADTGADEIIKLAGGLNAAGNVTGYKPLADEALIGMAPDAIVVMKRGGDATSHEEVMDLRGVRLTPAAQNDRVFVMGGQYLIGFGPRLPEAALDLLHRLHPQLGQPGKVN